MQTITLRVTRVVTPDGELVTIPNTTLTSQAITRPSGRDQYRVVDHVSIPFEDDVDAAPSQFEAAAIEVDAVLPEPAPTAYVQEFGGNAVVLRAHYRVERPRHNNLFTGRSTFARVAKRRLGDAGITISPASKRELQGRIEVDDGA